MCLNRGLYPWGCWGKEILIFLLQQQAKWQRAMHKQPSSIPKQLHESEISAAIPRYRQHWKDVSLKKTPGDKSQDVSGLPFLRRDSPTTHAFSHTATPLQVRVYLSAWANPGFFSSSVAGTQASTGQSAIAPLASRLAEHGFFWNTPDASSPSSSSGSQALAEMESTLNLASAQTEGRSGHSRWPWTTYLHDTSMTPTSAMLQAEAFSTGTLHMVYRDCRQCGLAFGKLCTVPVCFVGNKGEDGISVGALNFKFFWGSIKWVEFTLPWYNSSDYVRIAPGIGHIWLSFLITSLFSWIARKCYRLVSSFHLYALQALLAQWYCFVMLEGPMFDCTVAIRVLLMPFL